MAHIFFDFDSTLVSVETLDILITGKIKSESQKNKIEQITALGMTGKIPLFESLSQRLSVAQISQSDIEEFSKNLPQLVTKKINQTIEKLHKNGHEIHILSGGFKDYMLPTAKALNIQEKNIHANNFIFNNKDFVIGLNQSNPLCQNGGKGNVIESLNAHKNSVLIGDGFTDLEVFLEGKCTHFIGFGIHTARDIIKQKAPYFAETIGELNSILDEILAK